MKKALLLSTIVLFSFASPKRDVYVCESSTAYAYHYSKNCTGLRRCSHKIITMKEADAIKKGRKACKKCAR